jgi:hypothetical protein
VAWGSAGPVREGEEGGGRGCGDALMRGVAAASEGRGRGATVRQGLGGVLGFAFRGTGRGKLGRRVGFGQW